MDGLALGGDHLKPAALREIDGLHEVQVDPSAAAGVSEVTPGVEPAALALLPDLDTVRKKNARHRRVHAVAVYKGEGVWDGI